MTKQQYIKILEEKRKRRAIKRKIKKVLKLGMLLFVIGFFFAHISFSHTELNIKTISVAQGETLWGIAKRERVGNIYFKDKDVREIIYEIKKINNIDNNHYLKEGEELKIPTYN